ncbi:MAG: hypothetical protein HC836_44985 [Richelia sp. RM2_1_2]|nr:hypothetical protein [Richelia sp. RM2_1_2]
MSVVVPKGLLKASDFASNKASGVPSVTKTLSATKSGNPLPVPPPPTACQLASCVISPPLYW